MPSGVDISEASLSQASQSPKVTNGSSTAATDGLEKKGEEEGVEVVLGDQGKVIGPQLEGVGARGTARLSEDILWPDRNVDEAFRMTILLLESGESVSGLASDRTAESLLLTDQTGKQRRILLSEIEQEKPSKLSLMPGNFDELMTDVEFASLIGFLRSSVSAAK